MNAVLAAVIAACNAYTAWVRWITDDERKLESLEDEIYRTPLTTARDVEYALLLKQRAERLREHLRSIRSDSRPPDQRPTV